MPSFLARRLPLNRFGLRRLRRPGLRRDVVAGVVLGVQSVPDGLATGLLAGVSPLSGLYGYLVGTITGAVAMSSAFMVVQSTGAMAIVIADVPAVHDGANAHRALFTLAILTGIVMLAAGLFQLGTALRFVSHAVMVGFINAVGVNIVLGQLSNLTGYSAEGHNRVVRAVNTVLSPRELHWRSIAVGLFTIVLIVLLERTRLGPLGLVVAVIAASAIGPILGWHGVATLNDLGVSISGLPTPTWPSLGQAPALIVPALSLAFLGLVQGAGVAAAFPNADRESDVSRDFVGQGLANVACGLFRGMPVGGSMSASALNRAAGARSRMAALVAGIVMAVVIVAFGSAVGHLAMPALAGLLILIGVQTISPADLSSVWHTGLIQRGVLVITFLLTMLISLQYAVLVGVGASIVLYTLRQSNQVAIRRRVRDSDGQILEVDPPAELPAGEVIVLQPYGSLFFAAAPVFEAALPAVGTRSRGSVVILRLRGRTDLGTTFMGVLHRYALSLREAGSRLAIVSANERILEQLEATGTVAVIGASNIYMGDERVGAALERACEDAATWVAGQTGSPTTSRN